MGKPKVYPTVRGTDDTPILSVCIPVYNGARYLEEALNSLLRQDFTDFELVMVDDCSIDDSAAIIARCKDPRLKMHRNEKRLGLVGNWNRCLELARGRYVTLFHQDDVMQPHNLKRKVELLERHPNLGIVYSDVKIIGSDGRVEMEHWPTSITPNSDSIIPGKDFFGKLITGYNLVCCPSVVARRDCFKQLGGFDPRLPFTVDWEMWLRIALHFDIAYLQEPLVYYRLHENNETNSFKGVRELEEEFRAKRIALEHETKRIPNYKALRQKVCHDLKARALRAAAGQLPLEQAKAYRTLAAEIHRTSLSTDEVARPARILFVTHEASRTGAPIVLLHILGWLRKHTKLEFEVLISRGGPLESEYAKLAVTHTPETLLQCPEIFDRFALIYSNTLCNGLLLDRLPYGDIPIITHLHELDYAFDANGAYNVAAVIKQTNHYIACAQIVADRFQHRFRIPREKFSVHYETIPFSSVNAGAIVIHPQTLREKYDLPENAFVVAGCGTVDLRKAPDLFVQMAACLCRQSGNGHQLRFIWIGKCPDPSFQKILHADVQRMGLQNEIKFIGELESPHSLLALADVFCLTSREDPFPLVMMEAAALGKPVVCFEEAGGSAEFCALGGGLPVPFLDVEAMAEKCKELMLNPALRSRIGDRAAELIRTQFDIGAVIPKLWRELENFLQEPPPMSKYRLADSSQMDIFSDWLREEMTEEITALFPMNAVSETSGAGTKTRTPRILFVTHEATRTGAPIVLLHILRWLRKHTDLEFEILIGRGGPMESEFAQVATTHTPENLAHDSKLSQRFSLIYSNTIANGLLLESLPYGDIPIITHLHELDFVIDQFGAKNVAAVIKQSNHFMACAKIVADRFQQRFSVPSEKFSVHYSMIPFQSVASGATTVPPEVLRKRYDLPENAFVLAACGTVDIRKAADLFVQLAARLSRETGLDRPLRFLWIGRMVDQGLVGLGHILKFDIRRLGLQNEIKFVGELASPHSLLALADVFCLTSREDPFPLVMMEAAALGKPVICMDGLGGGSEFCALGGGVSVPFLNVEAMAQQCKELMMNTALKTNLGRQAADLVRTRFDIDAIVPNLWHELESFLHQPPPMSRHRMDNTRLIDIFSEWSIEGLPEGLGKAFCTAREHVVDGNRNLAIKTLTNALEAAAETRDPEFLFESLLEISKQLAPLDKRRAEFLLQCVESMAKTNGRQEDLKKARSFLLELSNPKSKLRLDTVPPLVSIIIATFNRLDLTRNCLKSLKLNTTGNTHEIIVVDNGSTDRTVDFLKAGETTARLRVVLNSENLGFAKACNQGAHVAQGKYLLFLNNDTEVQSGWLSPLVALAEADPAIAAAGSKLLYPNGTIQHAGVTLGSVAGGDPLLAIHAFYKADGALTAANHPRVYQALTAACLLVRRTAFEAVGRFDEGFWNGYEDVDLCLRLQEHGWLMVYEPTSVVIHHESQSGAARYQKAQENIGRLHQKWLGKTRLDVHISADGETTPALTSRTGPYPLNADCTPIISIIILIHNQLTHTKICLESIERCTPELHELVLVDNGSDPETAQALQNYCQQHPNVILIRNESNLGFAAGNNQALSIVQGKFIVLLNNDTVVTLHWTEQFLNHFEQNRNIGLLGPMSNCVVGFQKVEQPDYRTIVELPPFAEKWMQEHRGKLLRTKRIIGFCMVLRRSVISSIGGLDERFGNGNFEDDDFCIRAHFAGFEAAIAEDIFIHHEGGLTFKGAGLDYNKNILRNWSLFKAKWEIDRNRPIEEGYSIPESLPSPQLLFHTLPVLQRTHWFHRKTKRWMENSVRTNQKNAEEIPSITLIGSLEKAQAAWDSERVDEAWLLTRAAQEAKPFHPEAWVLLGHIADKMGNRDLALVAVRNGLKLTSQYPVLRKLEKELAKPSKQGKKNWQPSNALLDTARPQLSVCVIARDEENQIEACLKSVQAVADQIVVVDTGSTDQTAKRAKSLGAEVLHVPWEEDFSHARNTALQHLHGNWILFLDADETICEAAIQTLKEELEQSKVLGYWIKFVDTTTGNVEPMQAMRLFRNAPGVYFQGIIQESCESSIVNLSNQWQMKCATSRFSINHHRYKKSPAKQQEKLTIYQRLFEMALEEDPENPNLIFRYALELLHGQKHEKAIQSFWEVFNLVSNNSRLVDKGLINYLLDFLLKDLSDKNDFPGISFLLDSPLARREGFTVQYAFLFGKANWEEEKTELAIRHWRSLLDRQISLTFSEEEWLYVSERILTHPLSNSWASEWLAEACSAFPANQVLKNWRAEALLVNGRMKEALPLWSQLAGKGIREAAGWASCLILVEKKGSLEAYLKRSGNHIQLNTGASFPEPVFSREFVNLWRRWQTINPKALEPLLSHAERLQVLLPTAWRVLSHMTTSSSGMVSGQPATLSK